MKVKCSACHSVFSLPDERIPPGKTVRVPCPKCRHPIVATAAPEGPRDPVGTAPVEAAALGPTDLSETVAPRFDMVEESLPAALLCLQNRDLLDALGPVLTARGLHLRQVADPESACHWWAQNDYELVVVDDDLAPGEAQGHGLLAFARSLPMHRRRKSLLCLISRSLQTMDGIRAFELGLELILHRADLDRASLILNRAISEHRGTYAVFNELGKERGLL